MARIERAPGVRYTVLVPNLRGAERAVPMGADGWELMLSVTDAHSRSNANRNTDEALKGMEPVVALARENGVEVTGSMATALGCPFEGKVPFERVLYGAEAYRAMGVRHLGVDRKSTRLNSSHANISYAVFCLKKKKIPML